MSSNDPQSIGRRFRATREVFHFLCLLELLCLLSLAPAAPADELELDPFAYADAAAIQAAWVAGGGSPAADVAQGGPWGPETLGRFACDYSAPERERCYWDRDVPLDLSGYPCFALRLFCGNPGPVSSFALYFHSPGGWYAGRAELGRPGWNVLVFRKEQFVTEGAPAGWGLVDRIRLSPWRGTAEDTVLCADRLWAYTPDVWVVEGTMTEAAWGEEVEAYGRPWVEWLTGFGVAAALTTDEAVEAGILAGAGLAILPYNPVTSETEVAMIQAFAAGGGRVIACYDVDQRITDLLGVDQGGWNGTDVCGIAFPAGHLDGLPDRAGQATWNFIEAVPSGPGTEVIGWWEDCAGGTLPYPAWLSGEGGAYSSHVLLEDDRLSKEQMVLALAGHHLPASQAAIAAGALDRMGEVALYAGFDEARDAIAAAGPSSLHPEEVAAALEAAQAAREEAEAAWAAGQYTRVLDPAFDARRELAKAYCLCQLPEAGEFRAFWNHSGTGAWPGDWARSAHQLRQCGFTAVFPNMLDGGRAHYASAWLPASETYAAYGDQVAQCLEACRARGIEVHVWKVNWNLGTAPQWFVDPLRSAGRTQVDVWGGDVDWLCPSHPDNRQLELNTLLEVATAYDVDGIHLDYIRYPDETTCYCAGCRVRFQAWLGALVPDWPEDCYSGSLHDVYRDWRALQITALVQSASAALRAARPGIAVSAAVFGSYPECRESVGQDWLLWVENGYLDFVQPMDYTSSAYAFSAIVAQQLAQVGGAVPVYPGIGATASAGSLTADQVIVQILETRNQGTGGFTLFDYGAGTAGEVVSLLGLGVIHPDLTVSAGLSCVPAAGTLPFSSGFTVTVGNGTPDHRRVHARIAVALAGGGTFDSWRQGTINDLLPGGSFTQSWNQDLPALGALVGANRFTLHTADVTPPPYNQPPYAPAGDTDAASCTVTGVAR